MTFHYGKMKFDNSNENTNVSLKSVKKIKNDSAFTVIVQYCIYNETILHRLYDEIMAEKASVY